ncbi:hypothetical protein BS47DRAFT_277948 [Hydnum rufescens UP504]|uniref:SGNH hydrolase-type esterase domain-containing protein n=1 Tax=Hydnum rufescens UP504 TaxID=1448309 RepID=A0A9P6DQV4_9AGAM|nr:hypothetical protein BS47DRAFT_277948 [Hydnum rufescens UP504]
MAANVLDSIMLFGDSITEHGWMPGGHAQLLADRYVRKLDVINRGLGGYNSEWGLTVFKQIFATKDEQTRLPTVRLLTFWWGANDAVVEGAVQHVDILHYIDNIHMAVSLVKSSTSPYYSPKTRIILMTPPPVNVAQRPDEERSNERTKAYGVALRQLGEELEVPVFDVWTAISDRAGDKEDGLVPFLSDGLHLTAEGYKIVFDGLMSTIEANFPELMPDNLASVYPSWEEVGDEANPRAIKPRRLDI